MVELDIAAGRQVLEALGKAGFPITLAMWALEEESDNWRLVIASPVYDAEGPRGAYSKILDVLTASHRPLDLPDIRVVSPNDKLVVLVSGMHRVSNLKHGIRLGDSYIGPYHFGGLYIYEPLETLARP